MVNVGIIGIGYWGANLLRTFNDVEGAQVRAIAEKKPGRVEFVRKRYPHVECLSDYKDLAVREDIDAVVISTPVPTHAEVAAFFLEAGKHVFVEKPLAHTAAEARRIRDLAKAKGLIVAVGHVYQFSPAVQWMGNALHSDKLGEVFHLDSMRINLGPPNSDVDVVWDLAPHDLSIILHILKQGGLSTKVKDLQVKNRAYQRTISDLVHFFLEFESGVTAHVHVSWVTSSKVRLLHMSCAKGTVVFDDMAPQEKIKYFSEAIDNRLQADDKHSHDLSYRPGDIFIPTLPRTEPLLSECRHFIECVAKGEQPINGADIGVEVVELLEQISPLT